MSTSRRTPWWAAVGASAAMAVTAAALLPSGTAAAAGVGAPTALSPVASSTLLKDLELRWAPVAGATGYQVQVLDDENPDVATVLDGSSPVPRWTVPVGLPTGEYVWRVRAMTGGAAGPWSAMATVRRGWQDAPVLRGSAGTPMPQLSWAPIPDASFYEVEVSPVSFLSPTYSMDDSFVCRTEHTSFTPYGVALGTGTVFDDPPGSEESCAYTVRSQADADADAAATPSPSPTATPSPTPSPSPSGTATPAPAKEPAAASTYIYGKQYFWRVRGRDGTVDERTTPFAASAGSCLGPWQRSGVEVDATTGKVSVILPTTHTEPVTSPECSRWSTQRSFVIAPYGVGAVDRAPSDLAVAPLQAGSTSRVSADPTFTWSGVPGAAYYRFYLSRDPEIGSVDLAAETIGTSITPVSGLALGSTTRYWAIQACGAGRLTIGDGDCGPITAPRPISQVTANPAVPQSFVATPTYLLATWATGAADRGAPQAYDVRVTSSDTGASTTTRTDRVATGLHDGRSSLVVASAGLAEGSYTFQVRPVDQGGRFSAWSAPSPVAVVDRSAPTLAITTRAGFADRTAVVVTASEPVRGVTAASTRVVNGLGAPVAGTLRRLSATRWSFTPARPWVTGGYVKLRATGVVDRAGKRAVVSAAAVRADRHADSTGAAIAFRRGDHGWTVRTSSDALGGSYRRTADDPRTSARASAAVRVYGTSVAVRFCQSPTAGSAAVYVDGRLRLTSSLYRTWTGCATTLSVRGLTRGEHTVVVVGSGRTGRGELAIDEVAAG